MKNKVKTLISYGAPAIIVMTLGLIILAVQGIWPFGKETIDFYDMAQQVAAEYTQVWDEMHGTKSMVFDWYTRLGRGIPGGTYITPGNLFLYFIPRDMILEGFSVMFIFKTMCMATTMRIFLKKEISECPDFYSIIFAVGYGLCGFVLMQYTIIAWMDMATVFPLLLMFLQRLLKDGKIRGVVICVALLYANGFYESTMVMLFVFLITGLYQVVYRPEKSYIFRLGLSVALGVGLTAWGWIPKFFLASGSQRFQNEAGSGIFDKYAAIVMHVLPDYSTRWWSVLGVSFAAAIVVIGMIKDFKEKNYKRVLFVAGSFVIVLSELVFESIMLFLHFGSYVNYPARNSCMIYIVFALSAATYAKDVLQGESSVLTADRTMKREKVFKRGVLVGYEEEEKTGLNIYVGIALVVSIILETAGLFWYSSNPGMSIYTVFRVTMLTVIITFLIYLFLILFKKGKFAKLSVFLVFAELIFYGVLLIGKPTYISGYNEEPEQEGNYINIAYQLDDAMNISESKLDRIKNPDTTLNTNYGILLRRATLSNWTQGTSGDVFDSVKSMGYSTHYTRILDSGGTVFSDALFHVTQVLSCLDQSSNMYKETANADVVVDKMTGEVSNYKLYDCRYILPFGVIVDDSLIKGLESDSIVGYYNKLYNGIKKSDNEDRQQDEYIAEAITENSEGEPINDEGSLNTIHIDGKKAVYFKENRPGFEEENTALYVNEEKVLIPSIQEADNTLYPAHFNNNCVFLGCFENEDFEFRIDVDKSIDVFDDGFTVFTIDLDKLNSLCKYYSQIDSTFTAGNRNLTATIMGGPGQYLMMPMAYSNDYDVKVNGVGSKAYEVNALFTAVPIENPENTVEIIYFPESMRLGIIISPVLAILVLISRIVICLFRHFKVTKYADLMIRQIKIELAVEKALKVAYSTIWGMVILGIYVIPTLYGCWFYISRL